MEEKTTIIRAPHDRENPYVIMDKRIFENPALSWKAKGLLGYLLSRPDDWRVILTDLEKRSADGKYSVRSAINELVEAGYMQHERRHNDNTGYFEWTYIVYESPSISLPSMVKPSMDNHTLLSTNSTNNEYTNIIDDSKNESSKQPALDLGEIETLEADSPMDNILFEKINTERVAAGRRRMSAKFQTRAQKQQWRDIVGKAERKHNGKHEEELKRIIDSALQKGLTDRARIIAYVGGAFKGMNDKGEQLQAWRAGQGG